LVTKTSVSGIKDGLVSLSFCNKKLGKRRKINNYKRCLFCVWTAGLFGGLNHSLYITVKTSHYPLKISVCYTLQNILYLTSLFTLTVSVSAKRDKKICNSLTNSN